MIFQHKQGKIASYSDKKIKCDFEQIDIKVTKSQLKKIESNLYNLYIRSKKLILEEKEELKRLKEEEDITKEINKLKKKYGDLTPLLEKIVKRK